jgi:hypothetical protein
MDFDEVFKDCPYNSSLQVSQYGRVMEKGGKILKQTIFKEYLIIEGPSDRNPPLEWVHRLVALTWLNDKYKKGMLVHHIDGDTFNNRVDNLERRTHVEHAIDHGWDKIDEHIN